MTPPRVDGASDVLIVGGGPTGCAAGIVLARAGVDVCVVDRARFPRDKVCGDAVSNDAVELIAQLGARAAVEDAPHALVRRAAAVFPDGSRVERTYERPGYIVPRYHLDDGLRRALEQAGARLLQGYRVSALTRTGERVSGALGPELRWSAKLVIAADGYGSVGLPTLGQPGPKGRYLAVAASAYYRGVRFPYEASSDHFFERELPYGYGWIFPAVDGVANVGVYLRADGYARAGKPLSALLAGFLERHADRLGKASAVGRPRVWSLPLAPRPLPIAAPGLLLAGDAASLVDPLSGEGIWQGLRSGMLAGELATEACALGALTPALQRRYQETCAREIGRASRAKAWTQAVIDLLVRRKLYSSRLVLSALSLGYRGHVLEMTKS